MSAWIELELVIWRRDNIWTDALEVLGCRKLVVCSPKHQRQAVVLASIAGSDNLALHWVRLMQLRIWKRHRGLCMLYDAAALHQWKQQWNSHADVAQMLADAQHVDRQRLLQFASEFTAHQEVNRLHCRGMSVPPGHIVATYLSALEKHQLSPCTVEHAHRLRSSADTSKQWGRAFRSRWCHEYGKGSGHHGVGGADITQRATVFMRWVHWVIDQLSPAGEPEPVIVNMDETMLSNIKPMKLGVVPDGSNFRRLSLGRLGKEVQLPRTSLIASACNIPDLQRHLPQMRLPRPAGGKVAGARAQRAYKEAGQPQSTVHGSSGWNTSEIMCVWLMQLVRRLRKVAPQRRVLLVMDECSCHTSDCVLKKCIALRVAVIIIPSRMTWLLQPLDTHAFVRLKADIRKRYFDAAAASNLSAIAPCRRVKLQGDSIHRVLVEGDWSSVFARSGIARSADNLRASLRVHVAGADLAARCPSVAELADIMNVGEPRANRLHYVLLESVKASRLATHVVAAAPPAAVLASARRAVEPSQFIAVPRLRLASRARLPPAMPSRGFADAIFMARPSRSPVVTRSRSSAALGDATSSAAAGSAAAAAESLLVRLARL